VTELETKFLLLPGRKPDKALRRLLQDLVWAGFQIHPKPTRLVHDVYFDTPDGRLRHAGWSLRCRHRSLALQLTCKQLASDTGGVFERREIEQTTLHEIPSLATLEDGPVLELLRRYVPACAELIPCFTQNNRRQLHRLTHRDFPRAVIELAMDRVHVEGKPPLEYVEFEGELKQGVLDYLEEFTGVMRAQPALVCSRASKFHRGLFNADPPTEIGDRRRELMSPDDTWTKLAASYLQEQLDVLSFYEPYAYEGLHIEGVHQMRVATRRMRAALKAFGNVLPEDDARLLADEAGWLCDVLGAVRDLDVHLEHLDAYRSELPRDRHPTLEAYEQHLRSELGRARRCLVSALDSRRYAHFIRRYRDLQAEAFELASGGPTIRTYARGYVPKRLKAIRKAGQRIDPASTPEAYHRLRIKLKKLRYGLEILEGPYGPELGKAMKPLRNLQSRLGDHQDACVAQGELAEYRETHPNGNRQSSTFEALIRFEAERAAAIRRRFPRDWAKFEKKSKTLAGLF
jgi:CHAD domain-containing protein